MDVRTRRRVPAIALLVVLAACTDDDDDGTGSPPGAGPGTGQAGALADLDRLIANADAYRFLANVLREDGALSRLGDSPDEPLITDLFADFERAADGDVAALLVETQAALAERSTVGCTIDGSYGGASFDDVPDEEDVEDEPGRYVSAGDALPVNDETRVLGALRAESPDTGVPDVGPFYEWDAPEALDRTTVGTVSVEVPGDVFPGVGTLTLPQVPLDALIADEPLRVESTVRWEPLGDGGTIVIGFDVEGEAVDEDGDRDFLGIECVTADDGEFRVPDATLARLPEAVNEAGVLYAERVRTDVLPVGEAVVFQTRNTLRFAFGGE